MYWVLLGITGFYEVIFRFCKVSPGFTWSWLGFTGFESGFNEWDRVSPWCLTAKRNIFAVTARVGPLRRVATALTRPDKGLFRWFSPAHISRRRWDFLSVEGAGVGGRLGLMRRLMMTKMASGDEQRSKRDVSVSLRPQIDRDAMDIDGRPPFLSSSGLLIFFSFLPFPLLLWTALPAAFCCRRRGDRNRQKLSDTEMRPDGAPRTTSSDRCDIDHHPNRRRYRCVTMGLSLEEEIPPDPFSTGVFFFNRVGIGSIVRKCALFFIEEYNVFFYLQEKGILFFFSFLFFYSVDDVRSLARR